MREQWREMAPPGWDSGWGDVPYEVREFWRERGQRRAAREDVRRFGLRYTPRLLRWTERGMVSWGESDDGYLPAGSAEGDIHHSAIILDQFQDTDGRWYRTVKLGHETELDMTTLLAGAKANLARLEERAQTHWKVGPSALCEERAADEAEIDQVFQEEHLEIAREVAAKAALPEAERVSGAARDRAMRLGIDGSSDPRWTAVPWMSLTFTPGVEELEAYAKALHANATLLDVMIEEKLKLRGEIEIAAKEEAAAKKAAFEAAMSAPAGEAKWYLDGTGAADALAFTGRTQGQGFGLRVADARGKHLPGDRSPVAIQFPGRTKRFRSEISTVGLDEIWGSLPTGVGKQDVTLLGLVADPAWSVAVRHTHDGEATEWALYTAEGITTLQAPGWDGEERWTFRGWDGEEGKGPSKAALRLAHGLAPSKEEPPPPPAPLTVPATLSGLMGKWGKKR